MAIFIRNFPSLSNFWMRVFSKVSHVDVPLLVHREAGDVIELSIPIATLATPFLQEFPIVIKNPNPTAGFIFANVNVAKLVQSHGVRLNQLVRLTANSPGKL